MVLNLNHFGHALVAVGITGHVPPNGGVLRRRTPEALLPSTTTAWCRQLSTLVLRRDVTQ